MRLDGVVTCVNYGDFLAHTLPLATKVMDTVVVVTTPTDMETINLCRQHSNVKIVMTNSFFQNGDKFNKGRALNEGFAALQNPEWIIHFDGDMAMHKDTRKILESMTLDKEKMYGTGRFLCPSYESWMYFQESGKMVPKWYYQGKVRNIGVGFFQMFHAQSKVIQNGGEWYSSAFGHAGRSDRMFLRKFGGAVKIDGIAPVHLEQVWGTPLGANWEGRKTPRFGPMHLQ